MTALNDAQLRKLLLANGWPKDEINNAIGVIHSESGGNPSIVGWGLGSQVLTDSEGWPPPPNATGYDEAAVGLFQDLLSPAANVQPSSIAALQNPTYNSQVALNKYVSSARAYGTGWVPWTGDKYLKRHPELLSANQDTIPANYPYRNAIPNPNGLPGYQPQLTAYPLPQSSDIFTNLMISLNSDMNPRGSSGFFSWFTGSAENTALKTIFTRGTFTLGFGILGVIAILGLASGGKIGGSDIPGVAAGFLAGPETGVANLLSKMGVSHQRRDNSESLEIRRQAGLRADRSLAYRQQADKIREDARQARAAQLERDRPIKEERTRIAARNTALRETLSKQAATRRERGRRLRVQESRAKTTAERLQFEMRKYADRQGMEDMF